MILMKAIKPKRLQDKVMRMTLLNAMRRAGTQIKRDFEGTTKTWKHKVPFKVEIHLPSTGPWIYVFTEDQIYIWVHEGTGGKGTGSNKYLIWAGYYTGKSEKKALAFPSMFTPKTTPGSLVSGPGGSGGETVLTPYVEHPGIKPRKFTDEIRKTRQPWFKRQMEAAMREARRKSGNPA